MSGVSFSRYFSNVQEGFECFSNQLFGLFDSLRNQTPDQIEIQPTLINITNIAPNIAENAMKIFGINEKNESDLSNSGLIDERYKKMLDGLEKRKKNVSQPISLAIDDIISTIKIAYITIQKIREEKDMELSSKNILKSPLDVFQSVQCYFPLVKAEVEQVNGESAKIRLCLTENCTIEITKALDTKAFEREITEIFYNIQKNLRTQNLVRKFHSEISSLPLSDWKTFRRVMYEREGNKCSRLIIGYLESNNSQTLELLSSLGLSPVQVIDLSEKDYLYFKEAFCSVLEKIENQKKQLLNAFEHYYPNAFSQCLKELVDQENKKSFQNQNNHYQSILLSLKKGVVGQDKATEKMASILESQSNRSSNKVFLFVGPTGVGKTELAKTVSKEKDNRFITFAMNQYQSEMDISRLFGSSSGFVGSTDKPHLAKALDRYKPVFLRQEGDKKICQLKDVVILFDEFEKSHGKVKQSLLTLFDEGYCEVNYTETSSNITIKYELSNCLLICTSNLYQQQILEAYSDGLDSDEIAKVFTKCNTGSPISTSFSPELLARMALIPFGPIPKGEHFQNIIKMKINHFINNLKEELSCKEISIENEFQVLSLLEERLYGDGTNIRKINNYLDDVKGIIYHKKGDWGSLEKKKITISCNPLIGLYFCISIYIEQVDRYFETGIPNVPF